MEINAIGGALTGGILIGLAVTLMLLFTGRVTGVSGILSGFLAFPKHESLWRVAFLLGLLQGGYVLHWVNPNVFLNTTDRSFAGLAVAGLLVGFGTVIGGGCTSGHGVCGVSRLSTRSVLATFIFILFGIGTVVAFRYLTVGR